MRFARSAAAGLGLGMLAGFAVALVRPRPPGQPPGPAPAPSEASRTLDETASDAHAGTAAGSELTGRVI
jgi:hypothetical protein